MSEISNPESVKTKAAYLVMYRRVSYRANVHRRPPLTSRPLQRTTRPIGAKTRELIDSAIQSRNNSRTTSEAGGPAPLLSKPNSPFGSTENLHAPHDSSTYVPDAFISLLGGNTASFRDNDDEDEDLYGDGEGSRTFKLGHGFNRRISPGSSDNGADVGSAPSSRRSSFDGRPLAPHSDDEPVDIELDEQVPSRA